MTRQIKVKITKGFTLGKQEVLELIAFIKLSRLGDIRPKFRNILVADDRHTVASDSWRFGGTPLHHEKNVKELGLDGHRAPLAIPIHKNYRQNVIANVAFSLDLKRRRLSIKLNAAMKRQKKRKKIIRGGGPAVCHLGSWSRVTGWTRET